MALLFPANYSEVWALEASTDKISDMNYNDYADGDKGFPD